MGVNYTVQQGRFVRDPELRRTQSGKAVCSFTLAVDRPGKDNGAAFIDCVAWEKTAEFISNYFMKGNAIVVEGRIDSRQYETKDGVKRTATEVVVSQAHFCEKKQEKQETHTGGFTPPAQFAEIDDFDQEQLPF